MQLTRDLRAAHYPARHINPALIRVRKNIRFEFSQRHAAMLLCVLIHIALFLLLRDALRGPMPRAPIDPIAVTLIESIRSESPPELQVTPFMAHASLSSEKLIVSPIETMMDNQFDSGPDNEDCMPEN